VSNKDWIAARNFLNTDPDFCRIEGGRVIYMGNTDITDDLKNLKLRYLKTIEYYLTDEREGDKIFFCNAYVLLEGNKIKTIKIP
jgi:hypothetical protein